MSQTATHKSDVVFTKSDVVFSKSDVAFNKSDIVFILRMFELLKFPSSPKFII